MIKANRPKTPLKNSHLQKFTHSRIFPLISPLLTFNLHSSTKPMKATTALISLSFTLPILGQVYTIPEGYTKVDIAAAASASEPTLTSISVTLLNDLDHSSAVTVNNDFAGAPTNAQTLSVSGITTWTATQWTATPHLAYIADENGAEEAFFITANSTTGDLTLSTSFDLLGDKDPTAAVVSRFPISTTVKIREANTIAGIFSSSFADFVPDDRVYVWDGSAWVTFQKNFNQSAWALSDNLFGNDGQTVIYPDEGIFVQRSALSAIELSLFGEVPAVPQISTITKTNFISTRVPVATTLAGLGVNDANWTFDDRLYIWNGSSWDTYQTSPFIGGAWAAAGALTTNVDSTPVSANSAVFVTRSNELSGEEGIVTAPLPYDPFAE
ncbi:hypothetical protein N9A94_07220 [Akkermansiaceae bacterium]|nr:hypothetical protein [Akkermansiaceae bacterium]